MKKHFERSTYSSSWMWLLQRLQVWLTMCFLPRPSSKSGRQLSLPGIIRRYSSRCGLRWSILKAKLWKKAKFSHDLPINWDLLPNIPETLYQAASGDRMNYGAQLMAFAQSEPRAMKFMPFILAKTLGKALGSDTSGRPVGDAANSSAVFSRERRACRIQPRFWNG